VTGIDAKGVQRADDEEVERPTGITVPCSVASATASLLAVFGHQPGPPP